ncbi:MAG TPA: hypothetical protein VE134_04310, partial [Methanomicrobiales archaeon]|nr:hypothetical protein [Methanomicrobiales archaeon]
MDRRLQIVLSAALIIVLAVSFWFYVAGNPISYVGFIVSLIIVSLVLSARIMGETHDLPDVNAQLGEDAKSIAVVNTGNAVARNIHVALVPLDIEFNIPSLDIDSPYFFSMEKMVSEAKVVMSFENEEGRKFAHTTRISSLGTTEDDLLAPMIPVFRYK